MDVVICKTTEEAVKLTARIMSDQVITAPQSVIGLATGRTMESVYAEMINHYEEEDAIDYSEITTFNLDEYVGLAGDNVNSYRYYMNHHLFNKINVEPENTNVPLGVADDIMEACDEYEDKIEEAGGIDIQLLGIGRTGHIAFNDPLSSFNSLTREVVLAQGTIEQNRPLFDNPDDMPYTAVTMGVGTILDARQCLMLITGTEKADIAAKAIEGPMTSMISASALHLHPDAIVILDEEAAAKLECKEYCKFVFRHDPRWADYQDMVSE